MVEKTISNSTKKFNNYLLLSEKNFLTRDLDFSSRPWRLDFVSEREIDEKRERVSINTSGEKQTP